MNSGWRGRLPIVRWILWLALPLALGLALRDVRLAEIGRSLGRLGAAQVLVLAVVNLAVIAAFAARWWVILAADGFRLPFGSLILYRLASFAVSYFTPGNQFGGEPLQVYLLHRRHPVPFLTASASVVLDRTLELMVNFSFLALGLGVVLRLGVYPRGTSLLLEAAALLALVLPVSYLLAVLSGRRPVSWLLEQVARLLTGRVSWLERLRRWASSSEDEVSRMARRQPRGITGGILASILSWGAVLGEWWLATAYLGLPLDLPRLIAVVTAARLAFLVPLPGAIGALEAGLVLSLTALGFRAEQALGLALLIRVRDVAFGAAGLWLGGTLASPPKEDLEAGRGEQT